MPIDIKLGKIGNSSKNIIEFIYSNHAIGRDDLQKLGIATLYVAKGKRAVVIKRAVLDQIIGNRIGPKSRNEDIKRACGSGIH